MTSNEGQEADTPRFAADVHLGKLARMLRLLGYDCTWEAGGSDDALLRHCAEERRSLLSRDRALIARAASSALLIISEDPEEQAAEAARRYSLLPGARPFTRCLECNGPIERVEKSEVETELQPDTRAHYDRIFRCRGCRRLFWEGSHHARMTEFIERLKTRLNSV